MSKTKPTVLVVEDDTATIAPVIEALQDADYTVVAAVDADQAISLIGLVNPQVVVLDLTLRSGRGADVLEAIRRDYRLSPIPVILMTGEASEHWPTHREITNVIAKPFRMQALLAAVRRALPVDDGDG